MNSRLIRMAKYYGVYMKRMPQAHGLGPGCSLRSYGEVTRSSSSSLISGLIPWWIQGLMALLRSGGGELAGRPIRRVHTRAIFCPGPLCISFSVLPVYKEGNESLCHMTELSRSFITHAGLGLLGATADKGSPMLL